MQDTCAIHRGSFSAIPFYVNLIEIERKIELVKKLTGIYKRATK